jgi:hypothetical protein
LLSTYSTIVANGRFNLSKFKPELNEWFEKCKDHIPNYEKVNGDGAIAFAEWFKGQ